MRSRYFDTELIFVRPADGLSILDHERENFSKYLSIELIDFAVILTNPKREIGILANESVQTLLDHSLGDLCHARYVDVRL